MEPWGGAWTVDSLGRVEKYLNAFITALKKQKFNLVYIDAFCGRGEVEVRGGEELPLLQEGRKFLEGSARRALSLTVPFNRYHFIDASEESLEELRSWLIANRPELKDHVFFHHGDVNDELPKVTNALGKMERAVLFLDPFGMQVDWQTMVAIAKRCLDLWYLVPTMALNRMVSKTLHMPAGWPEKLDTFLGTSSWRETWYQEDSQGSLFQDGDEGKLRAASIERIEADFVARLRILFKMPRNQKRLGSSKSGILFTLVFGCSNPDAKAYGLALKIANDLLKD
jgi:three-Cys-motif partner protein